MARDIAHYDRMGFWAEYFTNTAGKIEFIEQVVQWRCYGDPTYTFSDVEREIRRRLRQVDLLSLYRTANHAERDAVERAEFARRKAQFEPNSMPAPLPLHSPVLPVPPRGKVRTARDAAPGKLALTIG